MTTPEAWFARAVVELTAISGASFTRHDFAAALAILCAEACPGSQVSVVLAPRHGEPAVSGGSTVHAVTTPGHESVESFSLHCGGDVIGGIDVFLHRGNDPVPAEFLQPLADIAAVHLVRESALQAASQRAGQLEGALESRILIEQAKGMVAERFGVPMESAFGSLRRHARQQNERLADLCASVVNGDVGVAEIHIDYFAISASRRTELRERAIGRWRQTNAEALAHRERAQTAVSRSVELRVELEHKRALREIQMMGRAIDRHFRDISRSGQRGDKRPTVIVGAASEEIRSFAIGALRAEPRLAVREELPSHAEVLGGSIVGQPDLVILGPDVARALGPDLMAELHRYCPDSRTLVVVDRDDDASALAEHVDGVVVRGDAQALVNRASELCGIRSRPEPVLARADLGRRSDDGS